MKKLLVLLLGCVSILGGASPALAANNCSVTAYNVSLGPTIVAQTAFNCSANADKLQVGQSSPYVTAEQINELGIYTYFGTPVLYNGPVWGLYTTTIPCPHPGTHTWSHVASNYRIHWSDLGGHWGSWQVGPSSWEISGACA